MAQIDSAATTTDLSLDVAVFADSFATSCNALEFLRSTCHGHGFGLKKKRDNKAQTADRRATIYYYVCGRAGKYKNYREDLTAATRVCKTKTSLCGCSFRASVRCVDATWIIQIDNNKHNHEATETLTAIRHTRYVAPAHSAMVKTLTDAGATAEQLSRQSKPWIRVQCLPSAMY